jgi:hypothetical protein
MSVKCRMSRPCVPLCTHRDTGYFQFWGAPGSSGPEAYMDLWCAREYTPEWRRFLVDNNALIETGGQPAVAR